MDFWEWTVATDTLGVVHLSPIARCWRVPCICKQLDSYKQASCWFFRCQHQISTSYCIKKGYVFMLCEQGSRSLDPCCAHLLMHMQISWLRIPNTEFPFLSSFGRLNVLEHKTTPELYMIQIGREEKPLE